MAEGVGFEPTVRFPAHTRSRRAPSTTRPPLRELVKQARNIAGCPPDASADLRGLASPIRAAATSQRHAPRSCLAVACGRYYKVCGRAVSSVVERLVYTEDVGSSTLSPPTIVRILSEASALANRAGGRIEAATKHPVEVRHVVEA